MKREQTDRSDASSLKQRTASGLFWGGLGNGLQQLIGFVFGLVLMDILTPADYGVVGVLAIFSGIASCMTEAGFTNALANRRTIAHDDYNAVFWFSSAMGVSLYLLLFFCAPLIAQFYAMPELTSLSRVVFLGFLFGSFSVSHVAMLFKQMRVKERTLSDLIAIICSSTVALAMAYNGFGYWAVALQGVTFIGVGSLVRLFFVRWRPTLTFNPQPLREMFGFGSKLLITAMIWQVNANLFSVILGKFYTKSQVGDYTQGNKWMTMGATVLSGMINSVAQPIFAEVKEDKERLLGVFRKMLRFNAFVSFPAMLGIAFIIREFVLISVGEKWIGTVPIVQILCICGACYGLWNQYAFLLFSQAKSDLYMWGVVGVVTIQLGGMWLVSPFGILAMVGAYVFSFLCGIAFFHYQVGRIIALRWWMVVKDVSPYLIITLISFTVAYVATASIENLYLLFAGKILISAPCYILILWKSNSVIFKEMIGFLRKKR